MLAERISNYFENNATPLLMADNRPISVVWARSMFEKEAVFRIRYKVYCERLAYENTTQNPDEMEMDLFDGWSKHILIRDDITSEFVGTARIVEPLSEAQKIPLEAHYSGEFISKDISPVRQKAGSYIELSRLAVDTQFVTGATKKYSVEIGKLLYLTALAYFQNTGHISHLYWLSEKWLARRLAMIGILSDQIGSFMEFKGQRAPFLMKKRAASQPSLCPESAHLSLQPAPLNLQNETRLTYQKIIANELHTPTPVAI